MAVATLEMATPSPSHLFSSSSSSSSSSLTPHNFPTKHKLTLEVVKRIWLSYSSLSRHCPQNISISASPANVLCLDLGHSMAASAAASIVSMPPPTITTVTAAIPLLSTSTLIPTMEGGERELGEISDDFKEESRPSSLSDSQDDSSPASRNHHHHRVIDRARSTLTDSFYKTLKTRDPQCTLSREQVFQKYVAHLNDHQLEELMTMGRVIFDDLNKIGDSDLNRKHSISLSTRDVDDRRVRPRLDKANDTSPTPTRVFPMAPTSLVSHPSPAGSVQASGVHDPLSLPRNSRPVLVMVKEGRPHAAMIDAIFDLNNILRLPVSSSIESFFRILLCCRNKRAVELCTYTERQATTLDSPNPSYLADAFYKLDGIWPANGGLFVTLNSGHEKKAGVWTPQIFAQLQNAKHLDITNYVLPGENTMRLIQLHDHSSYVFFVLAVPRLSEGIGEGQVESCFRRVLFDGDN